MTQIQSSLIKNKDWTSRTLANPPPPDNLSFLRKLIRVKNMNPSGINAANGMLKQDVKI